MEESRRQGKSLYMCFVDFKKAFDTVPRPEFMDRMHEIGVPLSIQHGVWKLYEQVLQGDEQFASAPWSLLR